MVAARQPLIRIYCDESCHLERDGQSRMTLGALTCDSDAAQRLSIALASLKERHGFSRYREVKWTKVSPAKADFYHAVVQIFFNESGAGFRAVVVDKRLLRHGDFGQTHDDWYYKMYYLLLRNLVSPDKTFRIYLDIKDTHGGAKVDRLRTVLSNEMHDFQRVVIPQMQLIRSHETQPMQLLDILIGAVSYGNRNMASSRTKLDLLRSIESHSGYSVLRSTAPIEAKFNLFHWKGA